MFRSFLTVSILAVALAGCLDKNDYAFTGTDELPDTSAGDTMADGTSETPGPDTGCTSDSQCPFEAPLCDLAAGKCVACLTNDRCKEKEICKDGACVEVACTNDAHCGTPTGDAGVDADNPDAKVVALKCNPVTNLCEGCKNDDNCPLGFLCTTTDGICRPGCSVGHGCQAGRDCCADKCIDTTKEVTNCGGCGTTCPTPANTTMKCELDTATGRGACKVASCTAGWADCNGNAADGCEQDVFTTLANCGGCGTACTIANGTGVCEMGVCKVATCTTGFGNCDGAATNGCEQQLNTVAHCGACGTACSPANAAGDCSTGTCKTGTCNTGFGNCDGLDGNGCEINLQTNIDNCNTCGNKCPGTAGAPACVAGVCKLSSCTAGFGDCDGSGTCTTVITNNVTHCGACGRACMAANGTPQCIGTTCSIQACNSGFGDCNASYIDGCESPLTTLSNCGSCGTTCSRTNATATCAGTGGCRINTCFANFGNCDGVDSNGCEKSLLADVNNCGLCGKTCAVTNGTGSCSGGTCGIASCNAGFANCDTNPADCERAFATASNSCMAPEQLGSASGVCGYKTPVTLSGSAQTTKFFKLRLLNSGCSGTCKTSGDPVRARFTLANPAGIAYDLFVYNGTTCGAAVRTITGTTGGTASVDYDTGACDVTDIIVELRYKSGTSCSSATVTVNTATP